MPPALGWSRWRNGDCWRACFSWVKRVPSTKFMTVKGRFLNLRQKRRVVSKSCPSSSGCCSKNSLE